MSAIHQIMNGRRRAVAAGLLCVAAGVSGLIALESLPEIDLLIASSRETDSGRSLVPNDGGRTPVASQPVGASAFSATPPNQSSGIGTDTPTVPLSAQGQRNAPETAAISPLSDSGPMTRSKIALTRPRHLPASKLDWKATAAEKRLFRDVEYLASDELEGRGVRSAGIELAAQYIAEEYEKAGLETRLYRGGPFHEFELRSNSRKGYTQKLSLSAGDFSAENLTRGADFTALMSSPQGKFSLPVVFVGFGITAPEVNYDDYAGVDVRGKAVVVLRHEPKDLSTQSGMREREHSVHAYVHSKIENAIKHGAAAVLLCTDHAWLHKETAPSVESAAGDQKSEPTKEALLQTEIEEADIADGIPVVHLHRRRIEDLVRGSLGSELTDLEQRIDAEFRPASQELPGARVSGAVETVRSNRTLKNVVGSLGGEGPRAEETIVVGAHYDHLGRDSWGSLSLNPQGAIHNGADDNASGISVLLEVARRLAAKPEPLGRRVLFIAFSAEELGLIGSKRYVQDPLVPLDRTVAMLNLDMVGRLRNRKLTVYGVETSSGWPSLLEATGDHGLAISRKRGGYGPSDHASFYERGVPVLHFFTGFHPQYHRPEDDSPLVNAEGMRLISEYVADLVVKVSEVERLDRTSHASSLLDFADFDQSDVYSPEQTSSTPRLGIAAKAVDEPAGVQIIQLHRGGLAEKNGLRTGDIITSINGQPVNSIEQLKKVFQDQLAAKELSIRLTRSGVEAEVVVRLGT